MPDRNSTMPLWETEGSDVPNCRFAINFSFCGEAALLSTRLCSHVPLCFGSLGTFAPCPLLTPGSPAAVVGAAGSASPRPRDKPPLLPSPGTDRIPARVCRPKNAASVATTAQLEREFCSYGCMPQMLYFAGVCNQLRGKFDRSLCLQTGFSNQTGLGCCWAPDIP